MLQAAQQHMLDLLLDCPNNSLLVGRLQAVEHQLNWVC